MHLSIFLHIAAAHCLALETIQSRTVIMSLNSYIVKYITPTSMQTDCRQSNIAFRHKAGMDFIIALNGCRCRYKIITLTGER